MEEISKITGSVERNELYSSLAMVQGEIKAALKDATGQIGQQKTKYADLASCWDACRSALSKHGICVIQSPSTDGPKVTVTTILGHKSGQWISGDLTMKASTELPQPIGLAITYAKRYALCGMVGISTEDDDGSSASQVQQALARKPAAAKPVPAVKDHPPLTISIAETLDTMVDKFSSLKVFSLLKDGIVQAFGVAEGERAYYGVLGKNGVEHANEFKSLVPAKSAAREMMEMVESLLDPLAIAEQDVPKG